MAELTRFFPSPTAGPPELKTLWVTNMWPDEVRPYFGNYIKSQCDSLWELGLDVDVLYVRGLLTRTAYFSTLPEVRRRVSDRRYRVIHAHYGYSGAICVATAAKPLLISFCGTDLLKSPRNNGYTLKSTLEASTFRHLPWRAAASITKSEGMQARLPRALQRRNHVLPNGVDMKMFMPRNKREARASVGWDLDGRVVMFLGDPDDPRKNVGLARAAVAELRHEDPSVRLEVAFGYRPEQVPALMNAADALVFPSRSEGSPNAVKEAMASGLPIVATPVGDIPERFAGLSDCFVSESEPTAFARALDGALGVGQADQARARVADVSMERIAERLRRIYADVAR
jgi:teichuronic acid biosynthesis glycosyltransferase TuaC